jgi:pimeloyl-ACP methyl ester carboxylesterase
MMMIENDMNTTIETTDNFLSQDGTTISYLSMGSGPAVIVVPGALSLARDYTAFARALAEHFTVHIIERRGRGLSGPQGNDYSIVKECEDVLALQHRTGASLLVGHSFGGFVALEAARNTRAFARIAVYDPGVSIDGSIPAGWIPGYEKKLAEGKKLDAFVEFVRAMSPQSAGKTPSWLMKRLLPLFMDSHDLKLKLSLLQETLREHKEEIRLDNTYENYRQISASVLLMYGGKDQIPHAERNVQRLAAILSQSEIREFPTLNHFGINEGSPREVAGAVSAYFLKREL